MSIRFDSIFQNGRESGEAACESSFARFRLAPSRRGAKKNSLASLRLCDFARFQGRMSLLKLCAFFGGGGEGIVHPFLQLVTPVGDRVAVAPQAFGVVPGGFSSD